MVDPTLSESLLAWLGLIVILTTFALIVIGISVRAMKLGRRLMEPPKLNAEIDAKILMADNLHMHNSDAFPVQEFAAVNEARERMKRRG